MNVNVGIIAFTLMLAVAVVSCGKKSDRDQAKATSTAQQAGIEADRIASNTVEAAKQAAEAAKSKADAAVKRTGEILEDAGAEIEKAGESMQK